MNEKPSIFAQLSAKLETRNGRRIVIAITVIVAALMIFKSIMPAMSATSSAEKEQASVVSETNTTQQNISTLEPQLKLQKASNLTASLRVALPKEAVADQQLSLLTKLAKQTGVEMPTFEPGDPDGQGTSYQLVPVNLAIKGSLTNCLRFINGMRSLVRVTEKDVKAYGPIWQVNQLSLSPAEGGDATITLNAGFYIAGIKETPKVAGQ
jgi:Tfp pilus assembly protein PilO